VAQSSARFASVRPRRAVDEIIAQIRRRIQSGELTPGQKLPNERTLAEQLGVSRNTLREAIRMLEVSGLVSIRKGSQGGAFLNGSNSAALSQNLIDGISLRQYGVKDLVDVRLVLESYVVEQICEHASDEEIEELAAIAEASAAAESSESDYERRLALHMDFHRQLAAVSHNGVAEALMGPLLEIMRHFHLVTGPTGGLATHQTRQHLVQALRRRDAVSARLALSQHLQALQGLVSITALG
jgi:GntR family transcriptional regulator, transcriptional repressor for pyruvate dehydrogenase complex